MTIHDLLDSGITLQGNFKIRVFNEDEEIDGFVCDGEALKYELPEDVLEMEIKYMYPITNNIGKCVVGELIIEVEADGE